MLFTLETNGVNVFFFLKALHVPSKLLGSGQGHDETRFIISIILSAAIVFLCFVVILIRGVVYLWNIMNALRAGNSLDLHARKPE